MVMRPRHALAAAALLAAVTLGSWAALTTDNPKPAPLAASEDAPFSAPPATTPRGPDVTKPDGPDPGPAPMVRRSGREGRGSSPGSPATSTATMPATGWWPTPSWMAPGSPAGGMSAPLPPGMSPTWRWTPPRSAQRAGRPPGGRRQRGRPRRGVRHLHRRRLQRRLQPVRACRLPAPAGPHRRLLRPADPGRCLRGARRRVRLPAHRPARPAPAHPLGHRTGAGPPRRPLHLQLDQDQLPLGRRHAGPPFGHHQRHLRRRPRRPAAAEPTTWCGAGSW